MALKLKAEKDLMFPKGQKLPAWGQSDLVQKGVLIQLKLEVAQGEHTRGTRGIYYMENNLLPERYKLGFWELTGGEGDRVIHLDFQLIVLVWLWQITPILSCVMLPSTDLYFTLPNTNACFNPFGPRHPIPGSLYTCISPHGWLKFVEVCILWVAAEGGHRGGTLSASPILVSPCPGIQCIRVQRFKDTWGISPWVGVVGPSLPDSTWESPGP